MVADNLIDIQESSQSMWMRAWRCVACGNIVDNLILKHRMIRQSYFRSAARSAPEKPLLFDLVKLIA
jgi:hypothetical protein